MGVSSKDLLKRYITFNDPDALPYSDFDGDAKRKKLSQEKGKAKEAGAREYIYKEEPREVALPLWSGK